MTGAFVEEQLLLVSEEREAIHADHASSRPLSAGYENVGIAGEWAFGKFCGQMPDFDRRPEGDQGADFVVPLYFKVDVKTARKAFNLIHEQGKFFADIFVLAEYRDQTRDAQLLGWEWGAVLRRAPVKDFGYGVFNHYIPRNELREMSELRPFVRIIK